MIQVCIVNSQSSLGLYQRCGLVCSKDPIKIMARFFFGRSRYERFREYVNTFLQKWCNQKINFFTKQNRKKRGLGCGSWIELVLENYRSQQFEKQRHKIPRFKNHQNKMVQALPYRSSRKLVLVHSVSTVCSLVPCVGTWCCTCKILYD